MEDEEEFDMDELSDDEDAIAKAFDAAISLRSELNCVLLRR
jgi:hypothetical protein